MLSSEDNERLVRVGPGTPMGRLMRLYWIPFLFSKDLEVDGQPQRVRLLTEDLVAFRDTHGQVGLVDYACPHRGAPMVFGRNEESGLRCVYHGWKFDAQGQCLDMPAELQGSVASNNLRIKSYPCQERNGMVWAYLGPDHATPPPLPQLEWNLVPENQVALSMRVQECNWLQALEGEIDSAHAAILHGRVDTSGVIMQWKQATDMRPSFECLEQDFGMSIASRRKLGSDKNYWRVNQYLLPFYTLVPPQAQYPELSGHAWIPMDDEHTLCLMFSYHPAQPLYEKTVKLFKEGHAGRETGHHSQNAYCPKPITEPYARYWSKYNRSNAYQFSYDAQTKTWFSGMPGLWVQDAAAQSGVSPIYDRSKEHLVSTDTGIARSRKLLLQSLKALDRDNVRPISASKPEAFMVRAVSLTLPSATAWMQAGESLMKAKLGEDFGYQP
jgi:phthalate 4,5-dioxygenase